MTDRASCWLRVCRQVALATGLTALMLGSSLAQLAGNRFEGTLNIIWGDPRPGSPGDAAFFTLTMPDGITVPLRVAAAEQNIAVQFFGKRLVVQGRVTQNAAGQSVIAVERITLADPKGGSLKPAATGTRRVLLLLQQPHTTRFDLARSTSFATPAP